MRSILSPFAKDIYMVFSMVSLVVMSSLVLNSIAPGFFPLYFVYIFAALLIFWFFAQVGFEVVSLFSVHFYIFSIFLLLLTLIIGNVTRGTIRWIPIGPFTLQPAEIVRPFLLVFFANFLTKDKVTVKRVFQAIVLLALPAYLIYIQPSLGVTIMTVIGFLGVLLATNFDKKYLFGAVAIILVLLPILWHFMAPYQRQRVLTFVEPGRDPLGAGYNSLQSVIAAGEGGFFGRGLGKGSQTQLSFLPAKQTDFIFSSTAEELGFVGAGFLLIFTFVVLWRLSIYMENSVNPAARAYVSGFFLIYLAQVFIHTGMNMGLLPVTGLPFPLVSAGGSSLLATMTGLGIAIGAYRR